MPSAPAHEAGVKRLCRLAAKIDATTWVQGAQWYEREATWIHGVADATGLTREAAIAAYAALSPRLRLGQNRAALIEVAHGRKPRAVFGASVRKAQRCLLEGTTALSGPKVRNFAANLGGNRQAVTVDVWAAGAAGFAQPRNEREYERIHRVYVGAAKRLGVEPRTLQAAVWMHVRGDKPTD